MSRRFNPFKESIKSLPQTTPNDRGQRPKNPLLDEIAKWEYDSIAKIRQAADTVRCELQKLLEKTEGRTSTAGTALTAQASDWFEPQGYISNEEQLFSHRREWKEPVRIDVIPDHDRSPIYFIKLEVTNKDVDTNRSDRTRRQLAESLKEIDLSSKGSPTPPSDFQEIQKDQIEFELRDDSLDSIENGTVILLQISPPEESQLSTSLQQLTDNRLTVVNEPDALLTQLKQSTPSAIVIDMLNKPWNDLDQLLNRISQLKHVPSVYIRGTPPDDDNDRCKFFSKYPIINGIFENEQSLIVHWAMDTANEYKNIGDMYIEKGEKEKAHLRFSEGVAWYKRLSAFLKERKYVK